MICRPISVKRKSIRSFAFEDAADELRRIMNDQLRMKHIPYLEFVLDTGVEKMIHVTEVLKGVRSKGDDE